jgi:hypothetical protein
MWISHSVGKSSTDCLKTFAAVQIGIHNFHNDKHKPA